MKQATCPTCGRVYTDKMEIEFIGKVGECTGCDSIRAEQNWQDLTEGENEKN